MAFGPAPGVGLTSADDSQRRLLLALIDDAITDQLAQIGDCRGCGSILEHGPCEAHQDLAWAWYRYLRLSAYLEAANGCRSLCPLDDDQAATITRAIPAALSQRSQSHNPADHALTAAYAELGRQLARRIPGMIAHT